MSRPTRLRRMFAAVVAAVAAVCVLVAFGAAPADAKEPTDAESGGAPKAPMAASLSQVSELDALSGAVACAQTLGLEALAYTPESWNAYTTALVAAKALILGGADATTKAAAEEALGDLLDAIAGLRARPSRTSLDAILAAALSVGIDATAYTPQSWVAWRTALDEARATAADPNATQSAIDAASANILSAGGGLRYRVTTGALDGALRLVAALGLTSGDYTPTSWAVFAAARAQASAALADPDVTAPAAAGAVAALDAALAGLTPVVSTSALEDLIGATAGFVSEDYTPDSWATLLAAIASARDTVAAPASSGAVDQAIGRLRVGIAGLTPVVSKAALHAALALIDAMNLESADYTPASWRPYIEALTRARETLASSSSRQAVEDALTDLRVASNGLVRATPAPTPGAAGQGGGSMAPTPGVPAPSATPESNTVQVASAVRVKASQRTLRLKQGHSLRLTGYGYTDTGQRLKASWSSSAPSVAKVSALGKITALKPGKATVSLRVGAEAATVKVTVLRKSAPSPAVSKVEASVPKTLNVGETRYVTGTWAPTSATRVKATYKSANKAVAAIDSTGRLTAIGQGTTTITVEAGTKQAKYKIQVE